MMTWNDGTGKMLATYGQQLMKEERKKEITQHVLNDPRLMVIDLDSGEYTVLGKPEGHEAGRTQGHAYRRLPDSMQHLPFKVSPTLQLSVLLDMIVPMLAPEYNADEELDYENPENWSPLVKAAYRRVAEAISEATEMKLKPKEQAKLWKERHAKHRKAVDAVLASLKEKTLTTKSGDMICVCEATKPEEFESLAEEIRQIANNDD